MPLETVAVENSHLGDASINDLGGGAEEISEMSLFFPGNPFSII